MRMSHEDNAGRGLGASAESEGNGAKKAAKWLLGLMVAPGVLSLLAMIFNFMNPPFQRIADGDVEAVRRVMRGGDPWFVLCNDGTTPINPLFQDAAENVKFTGEFKEARLSTATQSSRLERPLLIDSR